MGWKCSLLFVGDIENGYFGTKPAHSPEKARDILHKLGYQPLVRSGQSKSPWGDVSECELEVYPAENEVYIGAYEKGLYLADRRIAVELETENHSFIKSVGALYPESNLVACALNSVVNYAAFAYYQKNKLIRQFACSADTGIIIDKGDRLPEDIDLYKESKIEDGKTIFLRPLDNRLYEYDISEVGEELIFAMLERPLAASLNQYKFEDLVIEIFKFKSAQKPFWKIW